MKSQTAWVVAVAIAHLALGLVYEASSPVLEASDEGWHYGYVRWLALGNPLPIQVPQGPVTDWNQEGSQPPLYYLIGAALTAANDTFDYEQVHSHNPFVQAGIPGTSHNVNMYRHPMATASLGGTALVVKTIRWFSLLISCVAVLGAYILSTRVFPEQESISLLAAACVAFNPMVLFINASVNNDNLLIVLSTVALVAILDLSKPDAGASGWQFLGLGLVLGASALTKVSGLVLWVVAFVGLGWAVWQSRSWRRFFQSGLAAITAVLVSGWWYVRNLRLYGEWLGLDTMVAIAGPRHPAMGLLELIRQEWYGFWLSFWGVFGAFNIVPAKWAVAVFAALSVLPVIGAAWWLASQRRRGEVNWFPIGLLGMFCLLTLVGVAGWTLRTPASQGRLMFGAVAPLAVFMAAGLLANFRPPVRDRLALGAGVLLAIVALAIPSAVIAPRYAPPRALTEADLPPDMRPVEAVFGESFELLGYTVDGLPRKPGESQRVTLYWRGHRSMRSDYSLALTLFGRGNQEVGKLDTWPGAGNAPTSQWPVGLIFSDTYDIPIEARAASPTVLRLRLAAWEGTPSSLLPVTTPNGPAPSTVTMDVGRLANESVAPPPGAEASRFEYGIQLISVEAKPDGELALHWTTEQSVPADFTVFVHLLDPGGAQVAQADGPPLNGDWPTSAWIPGVAFEETRRISLPEGLPTGEYDLRIGLYDPSSGGRLAAFREGGEEWPNDEVEVRGAIRIP